MPPGGGMGGMGGMDFWVPRSALPKEKQKARHRCRVFLHQLQSN